jgi:prolyl-tRNA synthetase
VEVGPRDFRQGEAVLVRRDTGEKITVSDEGLKERMTELLEDIQRSLYERARRFRDENTHVVDDYEVFKELVADEGGFLRCRWCGSGECEDQIKQETMATIRCIPLEDASDEGPCLRCGGKARGRVYFARAY